MTKIGFIGAECTGKTTVIENLVQRGMKLPVIKELVRDIVSQLGYSKPSEVKCIKTAQMLYLEAQIARQLELQSFVSDRTPLDNAAYMLLYASQDMTQQSIDNFLQRALSYTSCYDLLFYFPIAWETIEDDGFRNTDNKKRNEIQRIIDEMLFDFGLIGITHAISSLSVKDRTDEVVRVCKFRKIDIFTN